MVAIQGSFGIVDYIVFISTIAFSALIGVYFAFVKKQKTNNDLLVGGRNMSVLPIALSLLATYMSAILVLGVAGEVYARGSLITEVCVGALIFIPLGGLVFLPTLYHLKLTSAYEYLERRFESSMVRLLATLTFAIQITMYMGVVLFAPALAMEPIIGLPVWSGILIIGGCAALYTSVGGIKAVVWTDVFQILVMILGMVAVIIQGCINLGGFSNVIKAANDHGRIEYLNWTVDPFVRHTTLSIFFGQGALWLGSYGCNQTTVQRYCSLSSFKKAFLALVMTGPLVSFTMVLASISGIVIFANYAGCDPLTLGLIKSADQIAPYFVLEFLSATPGLVGLFMACLLSGALSTISSGLNSLAAVAWEDFLKHVTIFRDMTDNGQGLVVKFVGLFFGAIIIGMGFVVSNLGGILPVTLVINGSLAGPLMGVFLLGIFFPFANKYGGICGILLGHIVTLTISMGALSLGRKIESLEYSVDECSEETLSLVNITAVLIRKNSMMSQAAPEWPVKIYTISYLLYPLVGAITTVIVGIIASLLSGPTKMTKHQEKFLHPLVVKLCHFWCRKDEKEHFELSRTHVSNGHGKPHTANGVNPRLSYDNPGFDRR